MLTFSCWPENKGSHTNVYAPYLLHVQKQLITYQVYTFMSE